MAPLSAALLLLALSFCQCQDLRLREGKKLVKKVRKLGVGGLPGGSCPEFDGVQVTADPASCNQFYKCENGSLTLERCENGLLYDQEMALTDAIHNYCVYSWRVECGERPADRELISSPGCPARFGLFSSGEGCQTEYVKCEHGKPSQMPCEAENPNVPVPLGLAWDQESHSCAWPDLLTHLGCDPAERLGGFQCPQLRDLEGTFNEQFSPFPRFAVSDPRVYIICVDGRPRLQSCGAHDQFSQETLTCVRKQQTFG